MRPIEHCELRELGTRDGTLRLALQGRIDIGNAQRLLDEISARMREPLAALALDLSGVEYFDSGGGAVLIGLRQRLDRRGAALHIEGSTPAIDGFLQLVDQTLLLHPAAEEASRPLPPLARLGEAGFQFAAALRELVAFTGETILGLWDAVRHPGQIRRRELWLYMQRTGIDGLPIVALISFLMGVITAFQASIQLTQVGADIYIANLVGLSISRELGPLMTAIIAAGRSGAAFAAELGTMKVAEEVDALTTMGLDRTRFLVTPKVVSMLLMLPCLTLFADIVGVVGGLTVAVYGLDMPAQVYMRQLQWAVVPWDVYSGLIKSVVFAVVIAGVGCLRGFQASTGAESVGRVTTSAIVAGIFLIIVVDAIFTVIFQYW